MFLKMFIVECEVFFVDFYVGVLSFNDLGCGLFMVLVWYVYELGGDIVVVIGESLCKGKLLILGSCVSFCVQQEEFFYKYVSVEGFVVSVELIDVDVMM